MLDMVYARYGDCLGQVSSSSDKEKRLFGNIEDGSHRSCRITECAVKGNKNNEV